MSIDFEPYLRAIATTYKKWWQLYTLTDAEGEQPSKDAPPIFDFGLMVQTVEERSQQEKQEKKVERFSVLEEIRKYVDQHVLLVGRPGSGKSTALARLLLEEATQKLEFFKNSNFSLLDNSDFSPHTSLQPRIPILVELRDWQGSLSDLIHISVARHDSTLKAMPLDRLLDNALILFDGVNELPSEEARSQLAVFRRNRPKLPMVFTTRDLSLGGDLGIERKLEMQPLTEPQMQEFIRAYLPEQAEAMLRQLGDRLRELGQTPLLLWMLCEVFQQTPDHQLPSNLAGVFQTFTTVYENRSVRKHEVAALKGDVRPLSDRRLWKQALKALAAAMMQGKTPVDFRVVIGRDEAERELNRIFPNEPFPVRDILDDLLKYHLLQNRGTNQIEFRHQLIQDYYAAEHLLQLLPSLNDEQLKRDYLNYLKWTEAIALMLALPEVTKKQAVKIVELALEVDLMLGARLAGAVVSTYQSFCVALINNVKLSKVSKVFFFKKTHFIEIPDWLKINLLEETHSAEGFPSLRELLKNLDPSVRASAAYAIGRLGDKDAELDLIELQKDPNSQVRHAAKFALQSIKIKEVVLGKDISKLLDLKNERTQARAMLKENQKEEIRLERDRDLADLRKHLDSSESALRLRAVIEIGKQNLSEALPQLLEMLHDPDVSVRCNIISVLGKLGNANTAPKLLELINDSDSNVVNKTCEALGKLGNNVATSALVQVLEENLAFRIRQSAAKALGKLLDQRAIPYLITSLEKDESLDVRWEAAQSLANLGDFRAIPLLSTGLTEPCRDIRVEAIKSLAKLKIPEIQVPALEALKDPDMVVRDTAAKIMIELGDKRAIPQIASLLEDSNFDVSWTAVEILKKVDVSLTTELLPRLTKLLPSNSGERAYVVIRAIQPRCKYYNHKIWQEAVQSQEQEHSTKQITQPSHSEVIARIDQTTQQINQRTQQMANQPKYSFSNPQNVQIIEQNQGQVVGVQHNHTLDPEMRSAIADLQTLLTQLQTQHPHVTTEIEAIAITDAKFTEIKQSRTYGLANLRKQLLNPERHLQATKATLGEVAKHYLEESVWAKAILTYLDKLSEDPTLGA